MGLREEYPPPLPRSVWTFPAYLSPYRFLESSEAAPSLLEQAQGQPVVATRLCADRGISYHIGSVGKKNLDHFVDVFLKLQAKMCDYKSRRWVFLVVYEPILKTVLRTVTGCSEP